jgi:hypothetical protein
MFYILLRDKVWVKLLIAFWKDSNELWGEVDESGILL